MGGSHAGRVPIRRRSRNSRRTSWYRPYSFIEYNLQGPFRLAAGKPGSRIWDGVARGARLRARVAPGPRLGISSGVTPNPRILAFAGSARRESLNKKLLAVLAAEVEAAGGAVTRLDLNDLPLPLYHGDLEEAEGLPANAAKLVALIGAHAALLIAAPEYNSQPTPLLKNTIDWCTRAEPNPFADKVAAVASASPGMFGGVRSAQLTKQLLLHLGCHVIPAQCTVARAHEAFAADGRLKDARLAESARRLAQQLVATAGRLAG